MLPNPIRASLKELADKMTKHIIEMLQEKGGNGGGAPLSKVSARVST
jgi:hypothetical protein